MQKKLLLDAVKILLMTLKVIPCVLLTLILKLLFLIKSSVAFKLNKEVSVSLTSSLKAPPYMFGEL